MAYATPDTVREALIGEGRDAGDATAASLSDEALAAAIADATAEIDARVPAAPFTEPEPKLVSTITADIAIYLATLTHRKGNPLPDNHPVALRYTRAEALLRAASRGELDLTGDPDQPIGEATVVNPYSGDLFSLEDAGLGIDQHPYQPWVR